MLRKTLLILSLACLGFAVFAYLQFNEKQQLSAQLDLQVDFRSQLLEQVELNTQQRLAFERQIAILEESLATSNNQITGLTQSLQAAQAAANPDLEAIREDIRLQVEDELQSPQARVRRLARTLTPERILQMARSQVNMRYGLFLAELNTTVDRKSQLQEFLVELVAEQQATSMKVTAGEIEASEIRGELGSDFIEEKLAAVLTMNETEQFEDYLEDNAERQLRIAYGAQLMLAAPGLNDTSRNLVLDSYVENLDPRKLFSIGGGQFSNSGMVLRQLEALEQVRQEVSSQLEPDEFRQASIFLDQMKTNLASSAAIRESLRGQ